MAFDPGLPVFLSEASLSLVYGDGVFGPEPEYRRLDAIRGSLRDPGCTGPDPVYSVAMDVGRSEHAADLRRRMLLFGVMVYAAGRLGAEPVRSQGHIHAVASHCGWSTPEIYEIWEGQAVVYAQECVADNPGRCLAIEAGPGEQVVIPPGWAHYAVNADPDSRMVFGAWCDRQYGFVYEGIRARHGLAWFPLLGEGNSISWEANPRYARSALAVRRSRSYQELGLSATVPIYEQFARDPESLQWVSDPVRFAALWPSFTP